MHLQQALRVPLAQTASSGWDVPPKSITGGDFVLKHLVTRGEFTIGDTSPSNPTCPTRAELKHWGYFTVLKVSVLYLTLLSQNLPELIRGD